MSRKRTVVSRRTAEARGLKRYFTGKPCKRGHLAERYTSNGKCVACVSPRTARPFDLVLAGQVAWWCTYPGIGWYVLCLQCGHKRPIKGLSRGYSRPLTIDEVRPQPQRCHSCKKIIVEGILTELPDRYHR